MFERTATLKYYYFLFCLLVVTMLLLDLFIFVFVLWTSPHIPSQDIVRIKRGLQETLLVVRGSLGHHRVEHVKHVTIVFLVRPFHALGWVFPLCP